MKLYSMKQTKKLTTMLCLPVTTGAIPLAAVAGMFRLNNVLTISLVMIAGPAAILTATMLQGSLKERVLIALIAGIISTVAVALAAGFGPSLLRIVNLNILKIFGAMALVSIALLMVGLKIPENVPTITIILGVILGMVWR